MVIPEGFTETGYEVYLRTYSRTKPNGEMETWEETVNRVVDGNLALVPEKYIEPGEREKLKKFLLELKILPGGRHLWMSGVPGRQYLFNCHVAGWGEKLSDHFEFTFLRLMEGGGVGSNYSSRFLRSYGAPRRALKLHIVCDPAHPDYGKMKDAGVLSDEFSHEWPGAFPVEDSREGWASALVDLIDTYMTDEVVKHVDRVYDVSRIRAEGMPLRTFGGSASGPMPFANMLHNVNRILVGSYESNLGLSGYLSPLEAMEIDHEIGTCVVAGGNRRSARMSIVEWDDPYIFEFIDCKRDPSKHWTTNISVGIDDRFIEELNRKQGHLEYGPDTWRAKSVYYYICEGMLTNGEPGIWNRSLANLDEPGEVVATNPCGEICLEEWENCNLGHVNMDAFAEAGILDFDCEEVHEAHRLMARFLIRATYGDVNDAKQSAVLRRNRRIGVGHFGVHGFLVKNGVKYSEAWKGDFKWFLISLCSTVREAAREYAYQLRIPEPVKITTVAPTGTIAKLAGRTEGIHPIYAKYFIRRIRFSAIDPAQKQRVDELFAAGYHVEDCKYSPNTDVVEFPSIDPLVSELEALGIDPNEVLESADEISLRDMLEFQRMYQTYYADNAVSYTINLPDGKYTVDELASTLLEYLPYLKGTTVMVDGSREQAPYERVTEDRFLTEYALIQMMKDSSFDADCHNGACPVR